MIDGDKGSDVEKSSKRKHQVLLYLFGERMYVMAANWEWWRYWQDEETELITEYVRQTSNPKTIRCETQKNNYTYITGTPRQVGYRYKVLDLNSNLRV